MRKTILSLSFLSCLIARAQKETDSISLDLLRAPTSVAFNLLGISQSEIERPTDLTAFAFSVRNATNNFTRIPSNYAGEFAPGWLSRKRNLTLDRFNSKRFSDVFWQSFLVSIGVSRQDVEEKESDAAGSFIKTGLGIKFSIIRPTWTGETKRLYDEIVTLQRIILSAATLDRRKIQSNDPELIALNEDRRRVAGDSTIARAEKIELMLLLDRAITSRKQAINDSLDRAFFNENEKYKSLTGKASSFKIERTGPFLDFASGFVLDFPDERFNNSIVSKTGGWITGGYEGGNQSISFLGIARYLYQPDKVFADDLGQLKTANVNTFDAGGRLVIKGAKGRFNASLETIYRSVLNKEAIYPNWRLVFNAEYDVGINKKLTFAFGRNFDKTISKGGNLITALNLIAGFGNRRKLESERTD